jgi:acetyl-CoA carboxylase biotin carboxyl carrier protein
MAEKPSGPSDPLDVQRIHYLVRLMKRYDLTALDLNDGPVQIRLRRQSPKGIENPNPVHAPGTSALVPAPLPQVAPAAAQPEITPQGPPAGTAKTVVIESPMVGTFYASSAPDAPSFVTVGSAVQPDTIVCIIEAMKVFTDIPAGIAGTVAEILVKNGQSVEFSQPLFRVVPA